MAAARAKAANVGSAQWVQKEREQAGEFVEQEVEEFGYSVRNEMEWLNEHMAEIFSSHAVNFADVFKTPGKLRGKTPRTARKRDDLQQRPPLTDIFAPNAQAGPTPAKSTTFYEKVTQFQIAEDGGPTTSQQRPLSRSKSPQRVGLPGNTDSGYHGMTEDELEAETQTDGDTVPSQSLEAHNGVPSSQPQEEPSDEIEPASDESFMSAKEGASQNASKVQLDMELDEDNATVPDEDMEIDAPEVLEDEGNDVDAEMSDEPEEKPEHEPTEQELHAEMSHEPSETSSPAQPLARKSSFTFSSLPAREPLTAKRSIGGRNSHMEALNRNSVFARSMGKSIGVALDDAESAQEKTEDSKLQSKTSAQLLHERISMLGKSKEPRTSKSVPQALYPQLPQADSEGEEEGEDKSIESLESLVAAPVPPPKDVPAAVDDEDDDWIAPSKPVQQKKLQPATLEVPGSPASRPGMHKKAISTTNIPSPYRPAMKISHAKSQSVELPGMILEAESTTPVGSPVSKQQVEHMSASKKLWGAFKSARNLFASSAGSSAAAKLESHDSPANKKNKKRDAAEESKKASPLKMPGALWSETQLSQASSRPISTISASPSRKTRSSTESDKKQKKELKAQQKAEDDLEKAREKERQKANKAQEERMKTERAEAERREKEQQEREQQEQQEAAYSAAAAAAANAMANERPTSASSDKDREDMPPPPPPKNLHPPGKLRAPTRPVRPTREAAAAKAKPAPMNIRVASQSQRFGQPSSQESLSSSTAAPPPPPKTGLRTNSAQGNARGSTMPQNNSRVRALEAAARKKEQEEREKERKAEAKRELERKRAAKAEEERRLEQEKKAEEQRKLQESKLAAQRQAEKQAAEAKRREQQRYEQQQQRLEQQRQEQQRLEQSAASKAKAAHELAEAIQRERAEKQALPRGDAPGTLRQLGQRTVPDSSSRQIQPNPAKPAKRIFPQEDDDGSQRPGVQRNPPSYQSNEAKRRKTDDLEETDQRHSVMAPPKRPSTLRKETLSKVPYGYTHAPPPASHHASMFKSTVSNQHQLQHGQRPAHPSQTVQLSNARIPFAENANPPAGQHYSQQSQAYQGNENGAGSKFKTPARPPTSKGPPKSAKSSPMYANGDNIALPEIMTDSEDEDDGEDEATGGFRAPSWVASPALRDLLTQQQLVDPETVFGSIPDLKMEEVFKGAKNQERLKRFRDRGSSAMWHETGDAVTSEEKRRDMEARERVYKDGGWSYNNRV